MNTDSIVEDLRKTFGKQSILYADDMAKLIGSDHRVVKSLEGHKAIPLPTMKIGGRTGVSIYAVADWLASSNKLSTSAKKAPVKRLKMPARARASLGRSLLFLRTQIDFLEDIYIELLIPTAESEDEDEVKRLLARPKQKVKIKSASV